MRRLAPVLCLVVLTGCATTNPRHQMAVSSQVVAQSLFALQDAEAAAFKTKPDVITPAMHRRFNEHLAVALTLGKEFNAAVRGWQSGQPIPTQVEALKTALFALTTELTRWPDDVKAQLLATLNATYDAVLAVLLARGGA